MDLRERVVAARIEEGQSMGQIAERFVIDLRDKADSIVKFHADPTFAQVGLASSRAEFPAKDVKIAMADGKMPIYVLDAEGKLQKTLSPGGRQSVLMAPDELFIVGSYMLRFNQEKLQAMSSRDATKMRARAKEPGIAR